MALRPKISLYDDDEEVILTLKYYLKQGIPAIQEGYVKEGLCDAERLNNSIGNPWWREGMKSDYKKFANAVKENNTQRCEELRNKGLNISGKLYHEDRTAIKYAQDNNFTQLKEFLKKNAIAFE